MSREEGRASAEGADAAVDEELNEPGPHELAARIEVLAEENRRLREEYILARRTRYRRTAVGLGLVGAAAALGALAVPDARTVLFALAGTGLFAAVLVVYLTPERFVAATVADAVYEALASNEAALLRSIDLAGEPVYVPGAPGVRLFVPVHAEGTPPPPEDLDELFVVADDPARAGLALVPSAAGLFEEVRSASAGDLAADPTRRVDQLADALVEQFELADAVTPDLDPAGGRATVSVSGSALGSVERFDHPAVSLLAVGLADGLGVPVRAEVAETPDTGGWLLTYRWDPGDA